MRSNSIDVRCKPVLIVHISLNDLSSISQASILRIYAANRKKAIPTSRDLVADAQGRVIKVVAQLIHYLPQGLGYRVLLMQCDLDEVLESQSAMLDRQGMRGTDLAAERVKSVFQRQWNQTLQLLNSQQIPALVVSYADAVDQPAETAARVAAFVGDCVNATAMAAAIERTLYRQRGCAVPR